MPVDDYKARGAAVKAIEALHVYDRCMDDCYPLKEIMWELIEIVRADHPGTIVVKRNFGPEELKDGERYQPHSKK